MKRALFVATAAAAAATAALPIPKPPPNLLAITIETGMTANDGMWMMLLGHRVEVPAHGSAPAVVERFARAINMHPQLRRRVVVYADGVALKMAAI